jgi:hypothetical protein
MDEGLQPGLALCGLAEEREPFPLRIARSVAPVVSTLSIVRRIFGLSKMWEETSFLVWGEKNEHCLCSVKSVEYLSGVWSRLPGSRCRRRKIEWLQIKRPQEGVQRITKRMIASVDNEDHASVWRKLHGAILRRLRSGWRPLQRLS